MEKAIVGFKNKMVMCMYYISFVLSLIFGIATYIFGEVHYNFLLEIICAVILGINGLIFFGITIAWELFYKARRLK